MSFLGSPTTTNPVFNGAPVFLPPGHHPYLIDAKHPWRERVAIAEVSTRDCCDFNLMR